MILDFWPPKGQFSFQSQKKATPKNVQTTTQLHSSHTQAKQCSKFSKLGFNSTWIKNFQVFKRDLEKAEETEIKFCQYLLNHRKSKRITEKHLLCFTDYTKAFDCVDHNKLWKILKEMGILDHLTCLLRNLYESQEAIVRTRHGTMNWFKIGKRVHWGCILSPCIFKLYAKSIMRMSGWMKDKLESSLLGEISIPSDMQRHYPYGRKWRGTKKPLESERGDWKSWLKTQHSKN